MIKDDGAHDLDWLFSDSGLMTGNPEVTSSPVGVI
jgi:hypothetical protein